MLDPSLSSDFDINWVAGGSRADASPACGRVARRGAVRGDRPCDPGTKGSDITLFGPALNNHGRIIVKADSPFHKPADLIGKKIATQPKTTETYQQARVALSLLGIDLDRDFETFFGPPTVSLALFDRGDVDAVIIIEPTATRAVGSGARRTCQDR